MSEQAQMYQESRGQTGPMYVYPVSSGGVTCGYPKRPSIKGLKALVKEIDCSVLKVIRQGKSPTFYIEGPVAEVERITAWADGWMVDYRHSHPQAGQ